MTILGFHASHEQIHPTELLRAVQHAERVGFTAAMCSDHIAPWSERQGESGFAFAWLGAALATTSLPFGMVNAPGQRYHPAIVAHAFATLSAMFPGRFWAAVGSGEAANESITGDPWPRKEIRNARLRECVDIIRALHRGEEVSHDGLVKVHRARVWTRPEQPTPLIGAAVSVKTAGWVADWADGLITINQPHDKLRELLAAYRDNGGRGKAYVQVHLSYAKTDDEALAIAHDQWRSNVFDSSIAWNTDQPEQFDAMSKFVPPSAVAEVVHVSSDLGQHAAWLQEYVDLGFDGVYLHHVGKEQTEFLDAFGASVLPQLDVTRP